MAYEKYLEKGGLAVEANIKSNADYQSFKQALGMPERVWSCHTAIIDGYVVEGHMPLDVIAKLLEEKPQVQGIALPGMPSGSPGMTGRKTETWTIWSFQGAELATYMNY